MQELRELLTNKKYLRICQNITKGSSLSEDLLQHCVIKLYEKKITLTGEDLDRFFRVVVYNEWRTKSSKFNILYGRNREPLIEIDSIRKKRERTEDDEAEEIFPQIPELTDSGHRTKFLNWLDNYTTAPKTSERDFFLNEIFVLYLSLGSGRKVAEATGIYQKTVSEAVNEYTEQIKEEYARACNR